MGNTVKNLLFALWRLGPLACYRFSINTKMWILQLVWLLERGSARHNVATYAGQNKHRKKSDIYSCLKWDSDPRSQCSVGESVSCLRRQGHCDWHVKNCTWVFEMQVKNSEQWFCTKQRSCLVCYTPSNPRHRLWQKTIEMGFQDASFVRSAIRVKLLAEEWLQIQT
jgi:hypothetical protein